jgi:hypothetical protein
VGSNAFCAELASEEYLGGDSVFRIGHMGHLNPPMVLGALATIESGLTALGGACDSAVWTFLGADFRGLSGLLSNLGTFELVYPDTST